MPTTYIALLRGINVAGHTRVAMADLRRLLAGLGLTDVRTYLQSGNAVFTDNQQPTALVTQIEKEIAEELGLDLRVILRTRDELAAVVDANPFPDAVHTPTQLHVMFLDRKPSASVLRGLDATPFEPEQFRLGNGVLYLRLPNGIGRSKLAAYLSERRLGVAATTRNWNTAARLLELARTR